MTSPSNSSTTTPSVVAGQTIGDRYLIGEPIGAGGMGVVCHATHLGLNTAVAIKLLRPEFKDDAEFVRRFLNEARRAASLKGERIARVHDAGQLASGEPYLVMELLDGFELGQYLTKHGPLSELATANIAVQICEGLAEAHAAGIVHRDIKPSNVFLVRRPSGAYAVKILDFGISKQLAAATSTLTNADQSMGSPQYMSPEQMLDASKVDYRSDIWSLGVVIFELVTGRHPFDGTTVPEVCAKVLTAPPPNLQTLKPDLDPELDAIVLRCLAKDPADRYEDVNHVARDLERFVARISAASEEAAAPPPSVNFTPSRDALPREDAPIPGEDDAMPPVAAPALTNTRFTRRLRRAHVLGALGVAATLALGIFAFTRGSASVANTTGSPLPRFGGGAKITLTAGPEPLPLERGNEPYALNVARTAPIHDSTPNAPPPVETGADETGAEDGAYDPATEGIEPSPISSTSSEPQLTPQQVSTRVERYKAWLAEQGLSRIDAVEDQPSEMKAP